MNRSVVLGVLSFDPCGVKEREKEFSVSKTRKKTKEQLQLCIWSHGSTGTARSVKSHKQSEKVLWERLFLLNALLANATKSLPESSRGEMSEILEQSR